MFITKFYFFCARLLPKVLAKTLLLEPPKLFLAEEAPGLAPLRPILLVDLGLPLLLTLFILLIFLL